MKKINKSVKSAKKPTLKDAQKYLQGFFKRATYGDCQRLWDVLSALRGPDSAELDLKIATTAVIRQIFFKNIILPYSLTVECDSSESKKYREELVGTASHFYVHAKRAFFALGLDWNEVNPVKK
jgi:hypothetical protein